MTTRRQSHALLQSGNPDESLKQQYTQQNQAIIAKNIELTKTNAALNTQLRTAKYEEIVLRQEVLLLKRRSFEDEAEINSLKEKLHFAETRVLKLESTQGGDAADEEVKRQMLANMFEALLGIQHLLVPPTPSGHRRPSVVTPVSPAPSVSPVSGSNVVGQFENVTVARRRSAVRAPRPSITTRPNLANISEGEISIEVEEEAPVPAHTEIVEEDESTEDEYQPEPIDNSPIATFQDPIASTSQLSPPALISPPIQAPLVKPFRPAKAPPAALSATAAASISSLVDSRRPARRASGIVKSSTTPLPSDFIPPPPLPPVPTYVPMLSASLTNPKAPPPAILPPSLTNPTPELKKSSRRSSVVASLGKKVTVGSAMKPKPVNNTVLKEVQAKGERELWSKPRTTIYSSSSEDEDDEQFVPPIKKVVAIPSSGRRNSVAVGKQKEIIESEEEESEGVDTDYSEEPGPPKSVVAKPKPVTIPKVVVKPKEKILLPDSPPKRITKPQEVDENEMLPPPMPVKVATQKIIRPIEEEPITEGRRSRKSSVVSYMQPKLNTKMRRPDKADLTG